jgi:hypothetical protein
MQRVPRSGSWRQVGLIVLLCSTFVYPAAAANPADPRPSPGDIDIHTYLDANNLRMPITNLGAFALSPGGASLEYPRGSGKYCVFASGLWVGAKVDGRTRVTVGSYVPEFRPGVIHPDGTYDPFTDPIYRVYKIVKGDTLSSDYTEWPFQQGAPATSAGKPLLLGEQTLWCVYHDADPAYHVAAEGATAPLGIEVQQLAFAFDWRVAFGNVVFLQFKVINKLAYTLDSTYFGIWCDPDIGGYVDDLVGCDPMLGLGFAYNGAKQDAVYGSQPPCVGFDLLSGPRGDGGTSLGMTSFRGYRNGRDPASPYASYNYLKGLQDDGSQLIDPTTGNPTTFEVSGDPVSGSGWLDHNPGDSRFIMGTGPFTMAPGDTQEIALGIIVARGRNRIVSVRLMKQLDLAAQAAYDAGFSGSFLPAVFEMWADGPPEGPKRGDETPAEFGARSTDPVPGGSTSWLSAGPNPALEGVTIRFWHPASDGVTVRILDSTGRLVRTLDAAATPGREATVAWDGRDASNRRVPPGVYFVSLIGPQDTRAAKIVLLR